MDKRELFFCCKTGNLSRIRYLVEEKDVDLNVRDKWDGTPLYYACLCGHSEVVLYLLQNGATCDANTFDGERCLYGALTDNIRHLLHNLKIITATSMKRDKYSEFLRRAFETSEYFDIEFMIENEKILAHRLILSVRSKCLEHLFATSWKNNMLVDVTHLKVSIGIFKKLLQYLYMGEVTVCKSEVEAFVLLAKHFNMYYLVCEVEKILISNKKISVLYLQPDLTPQQDHLILYLSSLPKELRTEDNYIEPLYVDLHIKVQDCVFSCHKVFVCGRCGYFKALVADYFSETSHNSEIQVITLHHIEPVIFSKILQYIYTDSTDLSPENVLDVIYYADLFILSGLKKLCSLVMQENLTTDNVISVLKLSRLYDLLRLEAQCTEYMAEYLEEVIYQPEFQTLILDDANKIKDRQEIDTISLIDDIRYYIDNSIKVHEGCKKHLLISNFLEILKLKA